MADNKLLQQMLEHLVNDEQQKAEELFHEYVVAKSREIYESLIEDEIDEASKEEEDDDEEMDEAAKDQKEEDDEDLDEAAKSEEDEDEEMDENFEEVAIEGDDEMPAMGGDATDDLEGDLEGGDEMGEKSEEELFQDLDAIVDELQAKFDELKGGEEGDMDMGMDDEMKDSLEPELATVREYVEKVGDGHGAEKKGKAETADNKKSVIDNMKNDMGGTTANILSGRNGADAGSAGAGGTIKGSSLIKQKPQDMNTGNINVPGGKAGKTGFTHKEPGHGAEKKGSAESADNKQSLFRGRR